MSETTVLVIAGNYVEYRDYLRVHCVKPGTGSVRYVKDFSSLVGMRGAVVARWGTWKSREDLVDLVRAVRNNGLQYLE